MSAPGRDAVEGRDAEGRADGTARCEDAAGSDPPPIVRDLLRPAAWPVPGPVELVTTHASWVFLVGERAYKLKRPVDLGFLDFSTPGKRAHYCAEELRINRRFAPDWYLGLEPLVRGPGGAHVVGAGRAGEVVDQLVAMRRLPARGMLNDVLARGAIDDGWVLTLARQLAEVHGRCATSPAIDAYASPAAVRDLVLGNLDELLALPDAEGVVPPGLARLLQRRLRHKLDNHRARFAARVAEGRIREGHGDLHARNICLTDDGPVVFDGLEFSEAFRCGDVANDLAFLLMDLDARGYRAFARHMARVYEDESGDAGLRHLLPFYKTHRALVRAKVALLTAAGAAPDVREHELGRAQHYVHLAGSYHLAPAVVLTCGLPGTGKSHLARRLARALDARVLRSDVERKRLFGLPPSSPVPAERVAEVYGSETTLAVYRRLRRLALRVWRRRRSAVLDATFSTRAQREQVVAELQRLAVPWLCVQVVAEPKVVHDRMQARAGDAREVSDADWAVYLHAHRLAEPPDELPVWRRVEVRSPAVAEADVAAVLDRLAAWEAV